MKSEMKIYFCIVLIAFFLNSAITKPNKRKTKMVGLFDYEFKRPKNLVTEITLCPKEKALFGVLNIIAKDEGVTLRVVGGWVRDKLLGKNPNDIDFVIESTTDKKIGAYQFMKILQDRICEVITDSCKVLDTQSADNTIDTGTINLHLKKTVDDHPIDFTYDLDFATPRRETYTEDSRKPQIELGTFKDDARRRDLTINSLTYDISTGNVVDATGKGLIDLENGILRESYVGSLFFNPVHVLRLIRFAARYSFEIEAFTSKMLDHPKTRERFSKLLLNGGDNWKELKSMLLGEQPHIALYLLNKFGYLPYVLGFIDKDIKEKESLGRGVNYVAIGRLMIDKIKPLVVNFEPLNLYVSLLATDLSLDGKPPTGNALYPGAITLQNRRVEKEIFEDHDNIIKAIRGNGDCQKLLDESSKTILEPIPVYDLIQKFDSFSKSKSDIGTIFPSVIITCLAKKYGESFETNREKFYDEVDNLMNLIYFAHENNILNSKKIQLILDNDELTGTLIEIDKTVSGASFKKYQKKLLEIQFNHKEKDINKYQIALELYNLSKKDSSKQINTPEEMKAYIEKYKEKKNAKKLNPSGPQQQTTKQVGTTQQINPMNSKQTDKKQTASKQTGPKKSGPTKQTNPKQNNPELIKIQNPPTDTGKTIIQDPALHERGGSQI